MRLFVAVEVHPDVVAATMGLVKTLQQRVRRQASAARITWTTGERVHLTLAFIGSVEEGEQAAAIQESVRAPVEMAPFRLDVRGTGAFPERGAPRVLWTGADRGRADVVELAGEVGARLARVGIPPEERPFHPHLTLGRVRDAAGLRTRTLLDGFEEVHVGTTRVEAITLFESRLSATGPAYVALQRTPLGM